MALSDEDDLPTRIVSPTASSLPTLAAGGSPTPNVDAVTGNRLASGTRLGEFELVRTLGEGGFGIVYLAWDEALERKVAIKEYMPGQLATRVGATLQVAMRSERDRTAQAFLANWDAADPRLAQQAAYRRRLPWARRHPDGELRHHAIRRKHQSQRHHQRQRRQCQRTLCLLTGRRRRGPRDLHE